MDYLVSVLSTSPLRIEFAFHNAESALEPVWVPRTVRPLGYFVDIEITSADGQVAVRTTRPKVKLKLDPGSDKSYMELSPGGLFGAVFELPETELMPGLYTLRLRYDSGEFQGTTDCPANDLTYSVDIDFTVD